MRLLHWLFTSAFVYDLYTRLLSNVKILYKFLLSLKIKSFYVTNRIWCLFWKKKINNTTNKQKQKSTNHTLKKTGWTNCLKNCLPQYLITLSCVQSHLRWEQSRSIANMYCQASSLRSSPYCSFSWNSTFGHDCISESRFETIIPASKDEPWNCRSWLP